MRRVTVGAARAAAVAICLLQASCESAYPEILVVNMIDEDVLVTGLSWNGCKWDEIVAYGEATSPGRCLPGGDRIRFLKLEGGSYCTEQVGDGTIDGLCRCDGTEPDPPDPGLIDEEPMWFGYQTVAVEHASYGDLRVIELTAAGMEQDFSAPGPYGH